MQARLLSADGREIGHTGYSSAVTIAIGQSDYDHDNAVALADDDLRQLNDLNAQARQLEERLVKK